MVETFLGDLIWRDVEETSSDERWLVGVEETDCVGRLAGKGKVRNIKGNALVPDFMQFLLQYYVIAYPILIKSAAELSKCSLKYEPSLLTKQASLGWDNIMREL